MARLSKRDQDEIVNELTDGISDGKQDPDSDDWQAKFEQLDGSHQFEVNDAYREFAADAVGDEHWDSDN